VDPDGAPYVVKGPGERGVTIPDEVAGVTEHPTGAWMNQLDRDVASSMADPPAQRY
jgi:hypothetical protein